MEELFRRHWSAAHRAAWLVVHDAAAAEDVAQEAFLAAVRSLDRFDRRRPFAPWLNRIVVNRAIDFARARAVRREVAAEAALGEPAATSVTVRSAVPAPPGAAVRSFVVQVLGGETPPAPRARLGPLPPGRMLVTSPRGAWVVERDGSRRLLGPYAGATWSPRGLYVAAWTGDELRAVAPDGRVAWGFACPGRSPTRGGRRTGSGSPTGAARAWAWWPGDGTGGRALASRVRPAAPAWRPGSPHSLAWVAADGRVVVRDVDGGGLVWRSAAPVGASARELSWSADGRLLLMRGAGLLRLADVPRDRVHRVRLPAGELAVGAAWAPRGRRLAVVARRPGEALSRVLVAPAAPRLADRPVFATTGRLSAPSWSPDGARVLVRWPEADEWLLLAPGSAAAPGRDARIVAIAPVARRFGGVPVVRGWCCS